MAVFITLMLVGLGGLSLMALPGLLRRGGHHTGARGGTHGGAGHVGGRGGGGAHGGAGHVAVRGGGAAHTGATHGGVPGGGAAHAGATHVGAAQGGVARGGPAGHVHLGAHGNLPTQAHAASSASSPHAPMGGATGAGSGWRDLLMNLIPEPRAIMSVLTLYGASGYMFEAGFHLSHTLSAILALVPALLLELLLVRPLWNLALRFEGKEASPLDWIIAERAEAVTAFRNGKGIVRVTHDGRVVQLAARLIPEHAAMPIRVGESLRIEDVDTGKERVTVSLNTPPLTRSDS